MNTESGDRRPGGRGRLGVAEERVLQNPEVLVGGEF